MKNNNKVQMEKVQEKAAVEDHNPRLRQNPSLSSNPNQEPYRASILRVLVLTETDAISFIPARDTRRELIKVSRYVKRKTVVGS